MSPPSRLPGSVKVVVVGSGWHFLSGISYYTCRLSNALAGRFQVSTILMRRLLPAKLYPGRSRIGQPLSTLAYASGIPVFDGVDWYGVPTLIRAIAFLRRRRPDILILQWWTGTVVHSYLVLGIAARLLGARVVIEFHETQDTGEARYRAAAAYVRPFLGLLLRLASGVVVHSRYDQAVLGRAYNLTTKTLCLVPHGPYDHHLVREGNPRRPPGQAAEPATEPMGFGYVAGVTRLLFFGTIRPYKGLEDLIEAYHLLPDAEADRLTLTVIGETWEGWIRPATLIERSPRSTRIRFVNRYVTDDEVAAAFAEADAVVLPYRRSSASGPLHIAMSHGLPVIVTAVGGLVEATKGYAGAVLVPPGDPVALAGALPTLRSMTGRRYRDPRSWQHTVDTYTRLFEQLGLVPDTTEARRRGRDQNQALSRDAS